MKKTLVVAVGLLLAISGVHTSPAEGGAAEKGGVAGTKENVQKTPSAMPKAAKPARTAEKKEGQRMKEEKKAEKRASDGETKMRIPLRPRKEK